MRARIAHTVWLLAVAAASGLTAAGCTTSQTVDETFDFGTPEGESGSILDSQIKRYSKMAEDYPKRADLHYKVAKLHFQKENYRAALASMTEASRLDPGNAQYLYHVGRIHAQMAEWKKAADAFTRATEAAGKTRYTGLHMALAYALCKTNRWKEASEQFLTCVEIEEENPIPYYFLGAIADLQGNSEATIRYMREYLERGGRLYRSRAIEVLSYNGVVVEPASKTHEAAEKLGIGVTGHRDGRGSPSGPASLPGTGGLTPAVVGEERGARPAPPPGEESEEAGERAAVMPGPELDDLDRAFESVRDALGAPVPPEPAGSEPPAEPAPR